MFLTCHRAEHGPVSMRGGFLFPVLRGGKTLSNVFGLSPIPTTANHGYIIFKLYGRKMKNGLNRERRKDGTI